MAQISITASKDGAKHDDSGVMHGIWIIHTALFIPPGTEGANPEWGRYEICVKEVGP